jgi:uncharacterized Zn-binding protein involved in type VI secretion
MSEVALDGAGTSHGGTVQAVTTRTRVNGKLVVTIGAIHVCPEHGTNLVTGGSEVVRAEGMGVSRIGDVCACGATIVSGVSPDVRAG